MEIETRIGRIALHNRIVDEGQLGECLAIQRTLADSGYPRRLGEILIEKSYVDRKMLRALLRAQGRSLGLDDGHIDTSVRIYKFTPAEEDLIVSRARDRRLSPEVIDECFELQVRLEGFGIEKHLVEIAMERGCLPEEAASDILDGHESSRRRLRRRRPIEVAVEGFDDSFDLDELEERVPAGAATPAISRADLLAAFDIEADPEIEEVDPDEFDEFDEFEEFEEEMERFLHEMEARQTRRPLPPLHLPQALFERRIA